jgi:hypothetical protein
MRKLFVLGLILSTALAACAPAGVPAETTDQITALQSQVAELQGQVAELQTQVAALPAEGEHDEAEAEAFDVAVAQYVLNTAGFHGMAETLAETQTVDPAYGGAVTRVQTILNATTWPAELQEEETAMVALLEDFSAKLEADDGAGAAEAADLVHEAQHAFSESIDGWLGTASEHTHGD